MHQRVIVQIIVVKAIKRGKKKINILRSSNFEDCRICLAQQKSLVTIFI